MKDAKDLRKEVKEEEIKEEEDVLLCNHNWEDAKTTIRFSKKRAMVYPARVNGVCVCCQKNFEIILQKPSKT